VIDARAAVLLDEDAGPQLADVQIRLPVDGEATYRSTSLVSRFPTAGHAVKPVVVTPR
jgi:hypothetical protein